MNRNDLMINVSFTLKEPLQKFYLHGIFYYRYNGIEYKKFPIDIWEDICEWLDQRDKPGGLNKNKHFLMEWTIGKVLNYSNWNHPCPYDGEIFIKASQFPFGSFQIPQFLPSGRFRIDVFILKADRKSIILASKAFFGISDHRLEVF